MYSDITNRHIKNFCLVLLLFMSKTQGLNAQLLDFGAIALTTAPLPRPAELFKEQIENGSFLNIYSIAFIL